MSQAHLQPDPNKLQMPSGANSGGTYMLHGGIKGNNIKDPPLSTIPPSPLDESSKSQDFPPTFNTACIPLSFHSPSLTIGQQDPCDIQPITHRMSENRPIRRLPIPPGVGEVPVFGQKEREAHHCTSPTRCPEGKADGDDQAGQPCPSRHLPKCTQSLRSLADSSPTFHRRDKVVATMNNPY